MAVYQAPGTVGLAMSQALGTPNIAKSRAHLKK